VNQGRQRRRRNTAQAVSDENGVALGSIDGGAAGVTDRDSYLIRAGVPEIQHLRRIAVGIVNPQ